MLKSYFTAVTRYLIRYKIYSLINILGLAIGMACVLLIVLFIQDELSYDTFHKNEKRIYRVLRETRLADGKRVIGTGTSGTLGPALIQDFPEIAQYLRRIGGADKLILYREKHFSQRFYYVDPSFLEIFTFPLEQGDPKTALQEPGSVLLTEETAKKIFGQKTPIGESFTVDDRYFGGEYTVTGVLKNVPRNSSLQFDIIASPLPNTWGGSYFYQNTSQVLHSTYHPIITYIALAPGAYPEDVKKRLPEFTRRRWGDEAVQTITYHLQPLNEVYLHTASDYGDVISDTDPDLQNRGDIRYVYAFGAIAGFTLFIACANFINLSTAQSSRRIREVGLRKVIGAHQYQIMTQFLGESFLIAVIALIFALCCVELVLPMFNTFAEKTLFLSSNSVFILFIALGVAIFVGLLAGAYPAFYLSVVQPVSALQGARSSGGLDTWLRKGLVIVQFSLSILLIISTTVIDRQLVYISTQKLGLTKDQIIILPLSKHPDLKHRFGIATGHPIVETLRQELKQNPDVINATTFNYFVYHKLLTEVYPEGLEKRQMSMISGDEHFLNTFDIKLIKGTGFKKDLHININGRRDADYEMPYLLNETAVKYLGWEDPIGKKFQWADFQGVVVGVVRNFHNRSLREEIKPVFIMPSWKHKWFAVKIHTANLSEVMQFIEKTWSKLIPVPFEYAFLDDLMNQMYRSEKRFKQLLSMFSLLAIFVACLGLWGLATFTAERRTKEIGIRKTLGASTSSIFALLSTEFVRLVLIANFFSWPIAYYAMSKWLEGFAYRINLDIGIFIFGGIVALLIAILTVSYRAIRAALINPVETLRDE